MLTEIITADGIDYTVQNTSTGLNTISFVVQKMTANEAETIFRNTVSLTVNSEDGGVYGEYPDVKFESLAIGADEGITVTMHILTEAEKQIRDFQISQAEQDEVIAELLYGGGEA